MTEPAQPADRPRRSFLARIVEIEPGELWPLALSFLYFFFVLSSYYIIRPLRDEMGVAYGKDGLETLFLVVFLVMLAAVPLFGWIATRFERRRIVPVIYAFFIANLIGFWLVAGAKVSPKLVAGTFFVWVSVFVLFVVSLFWSFMSDHYTSEQAKRLYGVIAAGGSLGAICGPLLTQSLVHAVGVPNLLLFSAAMLTAALACVLALRRALPQIEAAPRTGADAGGHGILAGASHVLQNPYLLKIAAWVLLANLVGTYFYIEEQRIVREALTESAARVTFFSRRDLTVSVLQVAAQVLITGALMRRLGIGLCAAALPAAAAAGLVALAIAPSLWVIFAVMVAERAIAFGVSNPAARVLWTVVDPEDKYKAQNFIDTVVYRGGDAASVWIVNGLTRSVGVPLAGVAALLMPLAGLWLALSFTLAREQARKAAEQTPKPLSS